MSEPHERAAEVLAGTFLGILQQMEARGVTLSHIAVVAVVDDKIIHGHHVHDGGALRSAPHDSQGTAGLGSLQL